MKRLLVALLLLIPSVGYTQQKPDYSELTPDNVYRVPYRGIMDSSGDTASVSSGGSLQTTATINGDVILDTDSLNVIDKDGDDWEIRSSGDGEVYITNQDTGVIVENALDRNWTLSRSSDSLEAFLLNQDTNVRIVAESVGLAKEATLKDTLPRKVKRLWNLELGQDTVATYVQNQDTDVALTNQDTGVVQENFDTDVNVTNEQPDLTVYDQQSTAERLTDFNLKANSGLSIYRDRIDTQAGGAILDNAGKGEDTGYYHVRTSNQATAEANLESRRTGQYVAGSTSIYGIGAHLNDDLQGNQVYRMGAFTDTNGIGLKEDATGVSFFAREGGNEIEVPQQQWNKDTLDGDCDAENPSCLELDTQAGLIAEFYLNYYGEGPTELKILAGDTQTDRVEFVTAHTIYGENMILDNPNLPLTAKVENNGTADTFSISIGGRQYSLEHGNINPVKRDVTEEIYGYTLTASQGEWEPIMAIRKETQHNEVANTIRASFSEIEALTDNDVALRVTIGGTTSLTASDYTPANQVPPDESVVETYTNQDFTASANGGGEIIHTFISTGKNTSGASDQRSEIIISRDIEFVVWARPLTGQSTTVWVSAKWNEWF